jgi:PST family polysaccharide transporter
MVEGLKPTQASLTSRVRSGVAWNLLGQVLQQVLRIGFSIALARLLSPREFGLIGMVSVFTGFAGVFVNMGLGQAIIQRKELRPEHLSTAFTLSLLSSAALAGTFWLGAGFISNLYGEPILKPLVAVLSLQFLLSASTLVHNALLARAMRFKEAALIEVCAFVCGSTVAVVAAWRGLGVWSLVLNSLVYATVSMVLFWTRSGWTPRLGLDRQCARDLWAYGNHLMGYHALNYWARNADNYLIGKYCGAAELGAYARAYQLMLMPVSQITSVVSHVLFPALSHIQDDLPRFREVLLKSHRMIALVSFPVGVGLLALAEPLVLTFFGQKWRDVISLLRILAINGAGRSLSTQELVFNSLGRTDLTFKVGGVTSVVLMLSFLIGLPWGAKGVALSYTLAWWCIVFPFSWSMAARQMGLRFWHIVWNVREVAFCAVIMGIASSGVSSMLAGSRPIIPLGAGGAVAVFAYWAALRVLRVRAYREALELLRGGG